jgi:predicted RecB family endonuclease
VWTHLDRPLSELEADIASANSYKKGLALEIVAVKLARQIGLEPVAFRLRAKATGGSEVDLIADGIHFHYSRWLIQCKATDAAVRVEAVAREVGMAHLLNAHVIVMLSTGGFTEPASDYAVSIAEKTSLQVVLVGPKIFQQFLREGPNRLIDALHNQAKATLQEKRTQIVSAAIDKPK